MDIDQELKQQYINFENMGIDLISDIDDDNEELRTALYEMVEFIHNQYLPIIHYDTIMISPTEFMSSARTIYNLFCVDFYNVIIPNYLENINCLDIDQFDKYFDNTLNGEPQNVRTGFIKVLLNVCDKLKKLSTIDPTIKTNKGFSSLLTRYNSYAEIINFNESTDLVMNYFRPLFIKNKDNLIWRLA